MQSGRWIHRTVCCGCHELRGWLEIGEAPRRSHAGGRDVSLSAPDLRSAAIRPIRPILQFWNSYCALLCFYLKLDGHVSFFWRVNVRSGSKKQLMLSVAGIEKAKLDPLCKEAAAKEVHLTPIHRLCCRARNLCRESLYFLASWIGRIIQSKYKQMMWNKLLRHQHDRD